MFWANWWMLQEAVWQGSPMRMGKGDKRGKWMKKSQSWTVENIRRRRKRRKQTFKVDIAMVEQEDLDLASIIGVNDSGTGIDEILHRKSASRSNAAVCCAERSVRRELVYAVSKSASNMCDQSFFGISETLPRISGSDWPWQFSTTMGFRKINVWCSPNTHEKLKRKGVEKRWLKKSEKQKKHWSKYTGRGRKKNPQVPSGTAMAKSVSTIPFPRAGIVVGRAL